MTAYDHRKPVHREECVLRDLLDRWSDVQPEEPFAVFERDPPLTYAKMRTLVRRTAKAFQDLGVQQGENVFVWMPNCSDTLVVWFALNYIGAVYVPANTAYRGRLVEHLLANSGARLAIVHPGLVDRLDGINLGALSTVVVMGDGARQVDGLRVLARSALDGSDERVSAPARPIEPWDTQSIVYTSGTTGASKGVLSSYCHLYVMGLGVVSDRRNTPFLGTSDRFLITSPLFHVGGTCCVYGSLAVGASVALAGDFDTATFWSTVQSTGSTAVVLLGVMANFLVKQPPTADDRRSGLRHARIVPFSAEAVGFAERFGVETDTNYSMTEISVPLVSDPNPRVPGSCGKVRDGFEVRIVDEHDREVERGSVGELVLRTSQPWLINHGYYRDPEATAHAWRNGWFHTGDAFREDRDGAFYFVDRFKDSIRRRGENISSFEVETEVCGHPSVREAAAIPVPSEHGEDEVLVAIAPVEGDTIDPADLIAFLRSRMAHFMVPRYIRVLPELPKTPTGKVEKYRLRQEGTAADTWDREAAGIAVRRDRL